MSSGLGKDWEKILDDLRTIAPYYERGNSILSFGKASALRRRALSMALGRAGILVDVGSGPGSMAVEALKLMPQLEAVLVDPLSEMLKLAAENRMLKGAHFVRGVYEHLPFREGVFSAYAAGFTLRDAKDRWAAIKEARRILAIGGCVAVVDLGKPDSRPKRILVYLYWRLVAPLILLLLMGSAGAPYRDIYITVKKLPVNSRLEADFSSIFGEAEVETEEKLLGGVLILVAKKRIS